jgi:hypothetical protein
MKICNIEREERKTNYLEEKKEAVKQEKECRIQDCTMTNGRE